MSPEPQFVHPGIELGNLVSGMFFVFLGLMSLSVAAIRHRSGVRILIWIGVWSGMFGLNDLAQSALISAVLPAAIRSSLPTLMALAAYLILPVGTLSFLELSLGRLRRALHALIVADLVVAAFGLYVFFTTGEGEAFLSHNNLLASLTTLTLVTVLCVPKLSQRYLILSGHRVLTVGAILFALQALYANLGNIVHWNNPPLFSSVGFAILLLSFAYTAMAMIAANENRLLSIEKELEIARQLQFSILPTSAPKVATLRIAAAYEPMTAVAGDFYDFIHAGDGQIGFIVADVSGHGVPAALIASMIKVATQSVNGCADDPSEVLRGLGAILSGHLRGQFITAAYLWIDTATRTARYSAAGHPPLLHWNGAHSTLTRIKSNGLLFGVRPSSDYPSREISYCPGDRFLLYTDGVTEPENTAGEAFGDRRLEEILRKHQSSSAAELARHLLNEVRAWQPSPEAQDDMTLIVIDAM
ncbi:MAG: PP2C family protein-serine/threonine phosphatase [Terriglobales bacterium]